LACGDFVEEVDRLIARGEKFVVITCFGVYHHTMQHYRMLIQMVVLKPTLMMVSSLFLRATQPLIDIAREPTANKHSTISQFDKKTVATAGRVSVPTVRVIANIVGYSMKKVTWKVLADQRKPIAGYFSKFEDRVWATLDIRKAPARRWR
jgi:hypothetical protein